MQFCPLCKVTVAGVKRCCPLCGGQLTGKPQPETELFPCLPKPRLCARFVLCVLALSAITVSTVCVLVNVATGTQVWWSLLVAAGAGCAWTTAAVAIAHRRDMTQNIAWQVILLAALSFLWDRGTGWHGWSLDFVLPCGCAAGLVIILLLILLLRLPVRAFAGSLIFLVLLGLVPAVLVAWGRVQTALPSLICAGLSFVTLAALVLFSWSTVKSELHRRFHL